jgi:large subunit ribosomal protein L30
MSQQLEITQTRSLIGAQQNQRRTLRALGLRRVNQTVSRPDKPEIRGMVARVAHLVEVRYHGEDELVDVEPGQEPKGVGRPPAGASVADSEVEELRATEEEALGHGSDVALEDLVQHPPALATPDQPDTPKAKSGSADDEAVPEDDLGADPALAAEEEIE